MFARADTYFDLIDHLKFATYLMIHRDGRSIEDIFEMHRDRDAFAVAESYTATLDQAGGVLCDFLFRNRPAGNSSSRRKSAGCPILPIPCSKALSALH